MNTSRRFLVLTWVLGTAAAAWSLAGCLEAREGRVGAGPTAEPPAPPPSCAVTGVVATERGTIDRADAPEMFAPAFQLAGDRVLFVESGTTGSNAAEDTEVVRVAPGTGAREQVTFNDLNDSVLAVDGDAMLLARGERAGPHQSIVVRDGGAETVVETDVRALVPGDDMPLRWLSTTASLATWMACTGPDWSCATTRMSAFHAGARVVLREWPAPQRAQVVYGPEIADGRVVWAERGDDPDALWTVVAWTPGAGETVLARDLALRDRPRVSGEVVFAPTAAGMERVVLGEGGVVVARSLLALGRCSVAVTAGDGRDRALFSCLPAPPGTEPAWAPLWVAPLLYWDGAAVHALGAGAEGGALGSVASPRIDGEHIVWIAYDAVDAGCYAMDTAGRVMAASAERPELAVVVSEIGIGCMCCDAYWPTPLVGLDAGLVVWNYANPDEPDRIFAGPLGYARIATARECGVRPLW